MNHWPSFAIHQIGLFLSQKDQANFLGCCKILYTAFSLSQLEYRFVDLRATDVLLREYQYLTLVRCQPLICSQSVKSLRYKYPPRLKRIPQTLEKLSFRTENKDLAFFGHLGKFLHLLPPKLKVFKYTNRQEHCDLDRLKKAWWPPTLTSLRLNLELCLSRTNVIPLFPQSLQYLHLSWNTPLQYCCYDQLTNLKTLHLVLKQYPHENGLPIPLPDNLEIFHYIINERVEDVVELDIYLSRYVKNIPSQLQELDSSFCVDMSLPLSLQVLRCNNITTEFPPYLTQLSIFKPVLFRDVLALDLCTNLQHLILTSKLRRDSTILLPRSTTHISTVCQNIKYFKSANIQHITILSSDAVTVVHKYNLQLLDNFPHLDKVDFGSHNECFSLDVILMILGLQLPIRDGLALEDPQFYEARVWGLRNDSGPYNMTYGCISCPQNLPQSVFRVFIMLSFAIVVNSPCV